MKTAYVTAAAAAVVINNVTTTATGGTAVTSAANTATHTVAAGASGSLTVTKIAVDVRVVTAANSMPIFPYQVNAAARYNTAAAAPAADIVVTVTLQLLSAFGDFGRCGHQVQLGSSRQIVLQLHGMTVQQHRATPRQLQSLT